MTIRVALAAAATTLTITPAAAGAVAKGTSGHLARGSYGCPMPGHIKMVLDKADKSDVFAARELGDRFGCVAVKKGTAVFVEDESKVGLGYVCLKYDGLPKCVWALNDNIDPIE